MILNLLLEKFGIRSGRCDWCYLGPCYFEKIFERSKGCLYLAPANSGSNHKREEMFEGHGPWPEEEHLAIEKDFPSHTVPGSNMEPRDLALFGIDTIRQSRPPILKTGSPHCH